MSSTMMTDLRLIHQQLVALKRNLHSTFAGQVSLADEPVDFETMSFHFVVRPSGGIYQDCKLRVKVGVEEYPHNKPSVYFEDKFIHPNVDTDGELCLNIIENWDEVQCKDLESLVQGVLFILYEPNVDDALVTVGDMDELQECVEATKHGCFPTYEQIEMGYAEFDNIYDGPDNPTGVEMVGENVNFLDSRESRGSLKGRT